MEMSTLGRAFIFTGLAAVTPVNADEICVEENQNNAAKYDIQNLIYGAKISSQPDISIFLEGYTFKPEANYTLLSEENFADKATAGRNLNAETLNIALDVTDIVARVRQVFGLNAVQMSQVVRVSRPTLYNHLKGKDCDQSLSRYQELYALANHVDELLGVDIRKGLKSVLVDGKTLLSNLKEEKLDHKKILEVSHLIANKLASSTDNGISVKDQIRSSRSVSHFG